MKRKVNASQEPAHSHLPSATGHEDSTPLVLASLGWETLPGGQAQLLLECGTLIDYVTMPKKLLFGALTLVKAGWDEDRKAALYRQHARASESRNRRRITKVSKRKNAMSKKRKPSKVADRQQPIGPVPAEIPPNAGEHRRIEDVEEPFKVDKNDRQIQELAKHWGWGRLYEIEREEKAAFDEAKEL